MTIHQSSAAKGRTPIAYPDCAGDAVTQRFEIDVPTDAADGDILELGCVPAGCRVVDIVLDADKLDSNGAPAIVADVGIISGTFGDATDDTRACGNEFFDGDDVGQAGGVARPTLASAYRDVATGGERAIGVKIVTKAATAQAGKIGLTVTVVA